MKTFFLIALLVASVVAESVVSHFEDCEGFESKFIWQIDNFYDSEVII